MKSLDTIDLAILEALQQDGRMANVALAKQVGLSSTPCAERVKALEAAGLIRGYQAVLDSAGLGLGLLVFIEVALERTAQDTLDRFREAILGIPEIQECHMVAGGFDYLLKVRVPDMRAYRAFLGGVLSKIPGIRQTHTYPVMEEVKETSTLELKHLQEAAKLESA